MEQYETDRILLRPIRDGDTDPIVQWRNAPHVMQHFIERVPLTPEIHRQWLKTRVQRGEVAQFIIHEKVGNRDIGSVYLRDINQQHRHAEFGIFIGEPSAIGQGYGPEACCLICRYAFEALDLRRVYLRVLADNAAAKRTYEKCGFRQEGLFRRHVRIDGSYADLLFMGLLREDFGQSAQPL